MDDLVAWLTAQLDEDERLARSAVGVKGWCDELCTGRWRTGPGGVGVEDDEYNIIVHDEGMPTAEQSEHIARHDPDAVLADIAAKRAIVEACRDDLAQRGDGALDGEVDRPTWDVLTLLASAYADRPGYRQEWAP